MSTWSRSALALPRATDAHLLLAALSLTAAGVLWRDPETLGGLALALWLASTLVVVVYRFNRVTDALEAAGGGPLSGRYLRELAVSFAVIAVTCVFVAPGARVAA